MFSPILTINFRKIIKIAMAMEIDTLERVKNPK